MKNIFFILFLIFLLSCSNDSKKEIVTKIGGNSLEDQMIEAYEAGIKALDGGDVLYAVKKFNEAELLYPQSQ